MANKNLAARFGRHVAALRWTDRELADLLHCHHTTVGNWREARRDIPAEILEWLERIAAALREDPPPDYRALRPPAGRPSRE